MPYDPQVEALLEQLIVANRPSSKDLPLPEGRQSFNELFGGLSATEEVAAVEDRLIPGPAGDIPVRIYRPVEGEALPILVYFHGGGWVFGDLESTDGTCRMLANACGALVMSVHFRRAPEDKFPAALDDCYAATQWAYDHADEFGADRNRIAVGGDSSGGNLAAAVALRARDAGHPPLVFQLLIFPATDASMASPSYRENAEDPFLSGSEMVWYWGAYLGSEEHKQNPYASPLAARDFSGLPPALVVTCEFDPLRDEGEAYVARLREAGVSGRVSRYPGMPHGFVSFSAVVDAARPAIKECGDALREAFAR